MLLRFELEMHWKDEIYSHFSMFVIITATCGQLYEMKYISKMPLPFLILLSQEAFQSFSLKPHFTLDKNSPRITKNTCSYVTSHSFGDIFFEKKPTKNFKLRWYQGYMVSQVVLFRCLQFIYHHKATKRNVWKRGIYSH